MKIINGFLMTVLAVVIQGVPKLMRKIFGAFRGAAGVQIQNFEIDFIGQVLGKYVYAYFGIITDLLRSYEAGDGLVLMARVNFYRDASFCIKMTYPDFYLKKGTPI